MTDPSLDDLNPHGVFETALRAYAEGNPEPLALFVETNGVPVGYKAERLSELLREPKKFKRRANSNDRMKELLSLYDFLYQRQDLAQEGLLEGDEYDLFNSNLVLREPARATQEKVSIYRLIADYLHTTTDAVEKAHKEMKRKRLKV